MRQSRVVLLHAQRRLHQVVEHFRLGAADESRHIEMHHQRLGLAAGVNDIEDFFGDTALFLLQSADRAIDRIGDAGARRQLQRRQRVDRGFFERRHVQSQAREIIGGEHAGAAAIAEQRHALRRMLRLRRQRLENEQRVDELVERVYQDAAGLARQRNPGAVIAGERAGVRNRRRKTLGGTAALENHHRLARFRCAQNFEQAPPVLGGLYVHADDFGLRIGKIEFEQVAGRDVGAVSHGNEAREFEAARHAAADDVGAQSAALRDDAGVAGFLRADFGESDAAARRVNAQAVGTEQAHAAGARGSGQRILQTFALLDLTETA